MEGGEDGRGRVWMMSGWIFEDDFWSECVDETALGIPGNTLAL